MMRRLFIGAAALALSAAPAYARSGSKAEVVCRDGSTSHARRGACSHHGGVAPADAPSARAEERSARTAEERSARTEEERSTRTEAPRSTRTEPAPREGGSFWDKLTRHAPDTSPAPEGRAPPPRSRALPAGQPTARCRDGNMSYAQHHGGACSHHGGVAEWLR